MDRAYEPLLYFLILQVPVGYFSLVVLCLHYVLAYDIGQVGELTGLLTSDLGSLKDAVSENISRDHGLRALSEASYFTFLTMSA